MIHPIIIWDIDDVWHPWYRTAHAACVEAGFRTRDGEMPTTWSPHEEYEVHLDAWVAALDAWVPDRRLHGAPPRAQDVAALADLWQDPISANHHFVTARGFMGVHADLIRQITTEWTEEHFGRLVDSLHFSQDKGKQVVELGATHAIDDNYRNWVAMTEAGARTFLMDQPWNQDVHVPDGLRVHSISEFAEAIRQEFYA